MKITTGSLEVFESGIVRTGTDNAVKFDFNAIWVEFRFFDDGQKVYRSDFNIAGDNKGLIISLYNSFNVANGIVKPAKIGNLDGRELFLSFRTFRPFQEESWLIEYTFYKGDEISE